MRMAVALCCLLLTVSCKKETMTDKYNRFYKECLDMQVSAFKSQSGFDDVGDEIMYRLRSECYNKAQEKAYDSFE